MLHAWQPVSYQNGEYVVVQNSSGTTTDTTSAYAALYTGTVVRVDPAQRVIVFDNGRMWQTAGDDMVIVDGRPVAIGTVQPGTRVTVQNGYPVQYQNGRYVRLNDGTYAAVPGSAVRQTVTGYVTDVDRKQIKVKVDNGKTFKIGMPSTVGLKKGDTVQMDIMVTPGSSPSAAPTTGR